MDKITQIEVLQINDSQPTKEKASWPRRNKDETRRVWETALKETEVAFNDLPSRENISGSALQQDQEQVRKDIIQKKSIKLTENFKSLKYIYISLQTIQNF